LHRVRYTETATRCCEVLAPDQRRAIIRLVANIQTSPYVDNLWKFNLFELGEMYVIAHDNARHWVVYQQEGDLITISGAGINGPYVPLPEDD
jgi:hypothetical protein